MNIEFYVETIALICKVFLYFLIASDIAVSKSDTILTSEFLYVTFFFPSLKALNVFWDLPFIHGILKFHGILKTQVMYFYSLSCILSGSFQGKHCVF